MTRRGRGEDGIALVMALGVLFVLTIAVTASLSMGSASMRHTDRSNASQSSHSLAEAGLNNAAAVLGAAYDDGTVPYLNPPDLLPTRTTSYDGGTVTWEGEYCNGTVTAACKATDFAVWRITSIARVANPTGPGAADVTRRVTLRVPVELPPTKPASDAWRWVYSGAGPSPGVSPSSCNMTIGNQVHVLSPLYVVGNLCLENRAAILQPSVPSVADCAGATSTDCNRLVVGGWLWQRSTQNQVGTAANPLTEAHIAGGCAANSGSSASVRTPCGWNVDKVYVTPAGRYTTVGSAGVSAPVFSWNDYYSVASPGPMRPCTTAVGTVPVFDTSERVMNNSVGPIFNLTPSAAYTCRTGAGELSWDPATRTLKVDGTIFIDGSVQVDTTAAAGVHGWSSNRAVRYVGQGLLWLSGTLLIKNAALCATPKADWSGCDYTAWNPNTTVLGVAANGGGGQVSSTTGIEVRTGAFQGLFYATRAIDVLTTGYMQGPMISLTQVRVSQTGDLSFPPISILPGGAPGPLPPPSLGVPDQYGG